MRLPRQSSLEFLYTIRERHPWLGIIRGHYLSALPVAGLYLKAEIG